MSGSTRDACRQIHTTLKHVQQRETVVNGEKQNHLDIHFGFKGTILHSLEAKVPQFILSTRGHLTKYGQSHDNYGH